MHRYAISVPDTEPLNPQWAVAVSKADLRAIEFSCAENSYCQIDKEIQALKELKGSVETASTHIPFSGTLWNPSNFDEDLRKYTVKHTCELIEKTADLNCRLFTIHASSEPNPKDQEQRDAAIANVRRSFEEILPSLDKVDGSLNVELLPRSCIGNCPEDLENIVSGFPENRIGICFDVNHFNNAAEKVPDAIKRLASRIRSFHLSDYDGIDECHWMPGMGVLDWKAIMKEIRAIDHDILLIFECWSALSVPPWQQKRDASSVRIASFERAVKWLDGLN